jgi:hypothetical protein
MLFDDWSLAQFCVAKRVGGQAAQPLNDVAKAREHN